MKNTKVFTYCIALTLGVLLSFSSDQTRAQSIAHVDSDSVLRAMPGYKSALMNLETYRGQLENNLKEMEAELQALVAEYQEKYKTWPPIVLAEKEKKIQQAQVDLQDFQQTAQADLMAQEQKLLKPLYDKIKDKIDQLAKTKGVDYVVPKQVFLFANPTLDITQEVIKAVNQ